MGINSRVRRTANLDIDLLPDPPDQAPPEDSYRRGGTLFEELRSPRSDRPDSRLRTLWRTVPPGRPVEKLFPLPGLKGFLERFDYAVDIGAVSVIRLYRSSHPNLRKREHAVHRGGEGRHIQVYQRYRSQDQHDLLQHPPAGATRELKIVDSNEICIPELMND